MNRNQLKYLVIVAMLIDHIAWAFVATNSVLGQIMHFIGRLTAPTMAYFVSEGYYYTHNIKKYAFRLGIFAIISWIPFVYFEFGTLPIYYMNGHLFFYPAVGVIYTLFLGLIAIWLWDKGTCPKWCKILGIIGLCLLSIIGDWAIFNVLWCLFFYIYRDKPKQKWISYSIIGLVCCASMLFVDIWWNYLFMTGIFMVPILIQFFYNGKSGSKNTINKWFFYVFYPTHLLILGLLQWTIF